jgi:Holliday junction resolvase RusA-like endonuclease
MTVDLVILGPPRSKKTHNRIFRRASGAPFVMPSATSVRWANEAIPQLKRQWGRRPALTGPIHLRAVIHRATRVGDLTNYLEAVGDALQAAGVIANDRQILALDALLGYDKLHPRVELRISPMAEPVAEVAA